MANSSEQKLTKHIDMPSKSNLSPGESSFQEGQSATPGDQNHFLRILH